LGFKELDALHIACAESGDSDIFLTTDDDLLRRAKRNSVQLCVRVENPYTWLQEIGQNEHIGIDR
jgi:predicted nucleic acid-binding protein